MLRYSHFNQSRTEEEEEEEVTDTASEGEVDMVVSTRTGARTGQELISRKTQTYEDDICCRLDEHLLISSLLILCFLYLMNVQPLLLVIFASWDMPSFTYQGLMELVVASACFTERISKFNKWKLILIIHLNLWNYYFTLAHLLYVLPPLSSKNGLTHAQFFDEFSYLLELLVSSSGKPLLAGDFNFHVNDWLNGPAC